MIILANQKLINTLFKCVLNFLLFLHKYLESSYLEILNINKMRLLFLTALFLSVLSAHSQPTVDSVLKEMSRINPDFEYKSENLVLIPGTSVKMMPPDHFLLSEKVPGFIHVGTSTTIQVREITGTSWVMIEEAMTPEEFEKQEVKFISKSEIEMIDGTTGILYLVEFYIKEVRYERFILFAGDYHNTMWINASYPHSTRDLLQDILLSSILTAQFE